jgi:spermidine synthase
MNRRVELAVYAAFFVSGAAGLIYQVAWSRYLSILLGGTGAAAIIVLATFMGGLGLGAWLFGRLADTTRSRVGLYALLEAGIALWGAAYPLLFPVWTEVFRAAAHGSEPGGAWAMFLKIAVAVGSILPGSLLMGGSLPVLGKFLIRRLAMVGDRVAKLYFINSVGAVAGSLLAGFWLIQSLGLNGAMFFAAGLNLLVAAAAASLMGAERSMPELPSDAAKETPAPSTSAKKKSAKKAKAASKAAAASASASVAGEDAEVYPRSSAKIALWVIAISGGVSMMYEVLWIRMLALAFGSSTHTFALVVAAFILGISLGSFLLAFKRNDRGYYEILGLCEILVGLSLLLTLPIFMRLPFWLNQTRGILAKTPETFPLYQALQFAMGFAAMLPPTIFIGMTLPAASKVVAREMSTLGRKVGSAFAVNTFGAIVGAVLGGAVLMPLLGMQGALLLGIGINIALGALVLATMPAGTRRLTRGPVAILALAMAGLLGLGMMNSFWYDRILKLPVFREITPFDSFDAYLEHISRGTEIYHRDALDCAVTVIEWADGSRTVFSNGKGDASVGPVNNPSLLAGDMVGNLLLSHLSLLIHPNPKNTLVVGIASGATVGAASIYPGVQVDTVELTPEMAEIAKFFAHGNKAFYDKPNCRVIIDDARTMLALTDRDYDVIITQPSNPWFGGNAALFSEEFYKICRSRLRPGGFLTQWVQTYELQDEILWQIVRTVQREFPYITVWETGSTNLALICSAEPYSPDFERMRERFQLPEIQNDMRMLGLDNFEIFLQLQIANAAETGAPLAGPGRVNSDLRPYLEYEAPVGLYLADPPKAPAALDHRGLSRESQSLWAARYAPPLDAQPLPSERWRVAYQKLVKRNSQWPLFSDWLFDRWEQELPGDLWPRFLRATKRLENRHADLLAEFSAPQWETLAAEPEFQSRYLNILRDYFLAAQGPAPLPQEVLERALNQLLAWDSSERDAPELALRRAEHLAQILLELDRPNEALDVLNPKLAVAQKTSANVYYRFLLLATEAELDAGHPDAAAAHLGGYIALLRGGEPGYVQSMMAEFSDLSRRGQHAEASRLLAEYVASPLGAGLDTRARGLLARIEMARANK